VTFADGDTTLAGVLVLPATPGPHPAVAFVYGSDPTERTYNGVGTALWRHFAEHGIACLAWDKPGVGRSTGDYHNQDFPARAQEALAAVKFLRSRPEIRPNQVGLWGHSQGGAVIPLAASESPNVAFLIEVGGAQVVAWQQDMFRVEEQLRADGFPEIDIQEAVDFARRRMALIRGPGTFEDLERLHPAVESRPWFPYAGRCDRALFYSARRLVEFDPGPSWEKVQCPVLVIYGDHDTSLPAEKSLPIIRRGLERAGNRDVTYKVFERADHGMQVTDTGGKKGRARGHTKAEAPDFTPGYLETMSEWIGERFRAE